MKRKTALLFLLLVSTTVFTQNFEGKIVYKNSCKSKNPEWKLEYCQMITDSLQVFYYKNGDYKYDTPNSNKWTSYINAENKVYTKPEKKDKAYFTDASKNDDEILETQLNPKAIKILGYDCDELVVKCKSSIQKYYFNSVTSVNPKLFEKHIYGNLNKIMAITKSIPLKEIFIFEEQDLELESLAVEIIKTEVMEDTFIIPK